MKLLNFHAAGGEVHLGVVAGERVFDLTAAGGGGLSSVGAWLRGGAAARSTTERLLREWQSGGGSGPALATLRHAPLVDRDARIFCVGLNYADHAAENNLPPPSTPVFFSKLASVVIPHGAAIPVPSPDLLVDYEAEFAIVLGARAADVGEEEAARCIAGATIVNDVTARALQRQDGQWFRSKNCDGFGPMGPWLVTMDEVGDTGSLDISLRLNGQVRQRSNTRQLVFSPAALVSILSKTLTLEPGDVISTGTPAGIGAKQNPPAFLQPGDAVEIEVERVGTLRNTVGAKGNI
jgi:2,4-didehydro-3-deoxy-L-rhamnonate hydrolase